MTRRKKNQSAAENGFNPFGLDVVKPDKIREEKKVDNDCFYPFPASSTDPFPNDSSDPWSTDPSSNDPWTSHPPSWFNNAEPSVVNSSFDSSLQYSATSTTLGDYAASSSLPDPFEGGAFGSSDPFPRDSDVFMKLVPPNEAQHTITVLLQERLSIMFDDVTSIPTCRVIGFIYVKSTKTKLNSFCLTVRDRKGHVERWEEQSNVCKNITASLPHLALDQGDQVFRVSLRNQERLEAPVVGYSCVSRLKPIPILLKTKVQKNDKRCRVGIRIRANPNNGYTLTQLAVLLVVPLDVDGEKVTMSRIGGVWDEMKRTVVWTIEKLSPGEIIDIQAQFRCVDGFVSGLTSKFPVLVRCDGSALFSRIELTTEYADEESSPVNVHVEQSSRILYRKV